MSMSFVRSRAIIAVFVARIAKKVLVLVITLVAVAYPCRIEGDARKLEGESTQTLGHKLSRRATFVPASGSPLERLIQVAQHYGIPMGIEWVDDQSHEATDADQAETRAVTVQDLITVILRDAPSYKAVRADRLLSVSTPELAGDPGNFLNLQIPEFSLDRSDVFGAEFLLRWKLRATLHPERYARRGYGGGYGHAPGGPLARPNITFSGDNLTVREILNRIIATNGNALWVVRIIPSKLMEQEPFYAQADVNGVRASDFHWQIMELNREFGVVE